MNENSARLSISPYPKQIEFLKADSKYIAFGGARGGGKSFILRLKLHLLCCKYEGIQILLLRRTLPELKENHINQLASLTRGVANYRAQDKIFEYKNGSRIVCGYLRNEIDVLQYQGQAYEVIALDEATHFTEFQFQTLTESNRTSGMITGISGESEAGDKFFAPRMYITCNPGGVGHNWVKRLFITRAYTDKERAEDYTFIQSRVYDNKFLLENSPEYVRTLENLPENRRRAMLDGDWDVFEGQYFPEFNREVHVCEPFEIPLNWRIYRVFDYGLDMLAALIIAVDEQGNAYVVEEVNIPNLIIKDAAEVMLASKWNRRVFTTYAPPDMWNRRQETGVCAVDLFAESGLFLTKSNNARVIGWWAVKEYLRPRMNIFGAQEAKLKIFSTCPKLIKHISEIQADDKNFDDCATEPHEITHNCDALRYFCVEHKISAEVPKVQEYDVWGDVILSQEDQDLNFINFGI